MSRVNKALLDLLFLQSRALWSLQQFTLFWFEFKEKNYEQTKKKSQKKKISVLLSGNKMMLIGMRWKGD